MVDVASAETTVARKADDVAAALGPTGPAMTTVAAKVVTKGWRTSEFWLTALFATAIQGLTLASHVPGPWGLVSSALAVGLYSISRGVAKAS